MAQASSAVWTADRASGDGLEPCWPPGPILFDEIHEALSLGLTAKSKGATLGTSAYEVVNGLTIIVTPYN